MHLDQRFKDMAKQEKQQVPPSFAQRLDDTLASLPDKTTKRHRGWQKLGASIAAILAIAILLPNLSPTISYAMADLPVIGSFFKAVTFRTYEKETGKNHAYIEVPEILSGDNNSSGAEVINKEVANYTNELIQQFETEMHADGYFNLDVKWDVVTDTDKWFTLKVHTTLVMASSADEVRYYHIDVPSGEIKTLADIFPDDFNYVSIISEELKQQMQARMDADPQQIYWLDNTKVEEWRFEQITPEHNFYFNVDGQIVIPFNKYEVGPGSTGAQEFVLESPELYDNLLYEP